jgi:N-acetylmuramic acid 6-phosphate etherase
MEKTNKPLLDILKITPSPQSVDYVKERTQYHLHGLPTEQRHPATWNLSAVLKQDTAAGLKQIFSVDADISRTLRKLAARPALLNQAAAAVDRALQKGRRIYIYGCGSTGRLAKQMESALWRPFWKSCLAGPHGPKIRASLPWDIENLLTGEMTGGDKALISSLEGFEDLALVGRLQMEDHRIDKGDIVFAITEGGETSSVIGTIMAAAEQYGTLSEISLKEARENLYFICNNPEETLKPLDRSRWVLEHPAVTKLNLTTGPQAVTGSTRMQATTCETFIMGIILEAGIRTCLSRFLNSEEMDSLGFTVGGRLEARLEDFDRLRKAITLRLGDIAALTSAEADTYGGDKRTTYFAAQGLLPVFIDCAERSPTFHLFPLDPAAAPERRSWVQVWTDARSGREAWRRFLGRPFRGLAPSFYGQRLSSEIEDPYLRRAALASLAKAGDEEEGNYDFSFGDANIQNRGPRGGDLGVLIAVDDEMGLLETHTSPFARFLSLFKEKAGRTAVILVGEAAGEDGRERTGRIAEDPAVISVLEFPMEKSGDPMGLNRQMILKMLLNGHSTGVMARLGRVVGNTMTHVAPSNLKLIGRATSLILSHVNDTIARKEWRRLYGKTRPISYDEANAVLFDAAVFLSKRIGQAAEVELSIIRILEALRRGEPSSWEQAEKIAGQTGLENYLRKLNPSLMPPTRPS